MVATIPAKLAPGPNADSTRTFSRTSEGTTIRPAQN
jgi:hypothetical protein